MIHPKTILIVEDDELLLDILQSIIENAGHTVLAAPNGRAALDLFKQNKEEIALVFSDIGLPKLGGYEMYQKMKNIKSDTKIILTSGYFEPSEKKQLRSQGINAFILKPYRPDEILNEINQILS